MLLVLSGRLGTGRSLWQEKLLLRCNILWLIHMSLCIGNAKEAIEIMRLGKIGAERPERQLQENPNNPAQLFGSFAGIRLEHFQRPGGCDSFAT
jgi:hypothetical protein